MPAGVEVVVEDGVAVIEFRDPSKRGPGLAELFEHAPAAEVWKTTRPLAYHVPERYARAAGLLDSAPAGELTSGDEAVPPTWPEGEPSKAWRRDELDAYALSVKGIDTTELDDKAAAVAAIKDLP